MRDVITVDQAGYATLQDLGRPGHGEVGIPVSGASDRHSAMIANILVGNDTSAPMIEVTGSAFGFRTHACVVLAVTGAAEGVLVDGFAAPAWETLVVESGHRVTIATPTVGLRSYIAFNGAIDAEYALGSVSPDPLLGAGTRLTSGDTLLIDTAFESLDHPYSRVPLFRLGATRPRLRTSLVVDVTAGPDIDQFERGLSGPDAEHYEVSAQSDHIGLRLLGSAPRRTVDTEILSRGVPVGAVEIPPTGGLLVLLRGRLVTAGYPVAGVATATSIDRLGQLRPGDTVSFRGCDVAEAHSALRRRQSEANALAARVDAVFQGVGISHIMSERHLSHDTNRR